jgi:glycosyltransferase involved in cell wall biosynthesis
MNSSLKVSIITVCFNSEKTIYDTLKSVSNQTGVQIEHIIVDGASKDATLAIVKQFPNVTKVISEPDKGIYDAMNKGIAMATGDIIGTLNADDFYVANTVLKTVVEVFTQNAEVDATYADLVYVGENDTDKIVRFWKSQSYQKGLFKNGWMPAHPTFFAKKSVYEKFGFFRLDFKIAADFELLFRLLECHQIKVQYIPKVLVKMRLGGTTNKSIKNIWIQNREMIATLKSSCADFSLAKFVYIKLVNRLVQFTSKPKNPI